MKEPTLFTLEVERIRYLLEQSAQGQKEPLAYMLGRALAALAHASLDNNQTQQKIRAQLRYQHSPDQ